MQRALRTLGLLAVLLTPAFAQQGIERIVRRAEALGARTGVALVDERGKVLYRHRAAEAFAPASNMKLLTAMAVLGGLGKDFTFCTTFRLEGGALVVEASGDPNWLRGTADDPEVVFAEVAKKLRARGVTAIRDVVLRPGTFTGPLRPATWPQNQLYAYYCAPTGAFVLEQGTFVMALQATGGRNAAVELLAPPAGYAIEGSVREVSQQKGAVYGAIDRDGAIKVQGKFWHKSPRVEIRTSVNDPSRWFRDALVRGLARGGVRVDAAATADGDGLVYAHRTGLPPALLRMLEDSSNFDAEQCLRVLGDKTRGDGSLQGGMAALRATVEDLLGKIPDDAAFFDGSGLSKQNRLTPGMLVVALFRSMQGDNAATLRACLPLAGRTGTLERRFVDSPLKGRVRAKTGWIRGASSLSGIIEMADGQQRCFSILMSYDRSKSGFNKVLKKLQEEIVEAAALETL